MTSDLTFANAYSLHVKLRNSASRTLSQLSHRISEVEISAVMSNIIHLLAEERTPDVLTHIKNGLKQIPAVLFHLVGVWLDDDGLDILHHSIINNCPEIVEFLLIEPKWFPQTHVPGKNPYAHLAAMFGFTECLRLVLQYRPNDYFSGTNQSHIIKLPPYVRKKLKFVDVRRSKIQKSIEKLLNKIKSSSEIAETEMQHVQGHKTTDVGNVLKNELEALEGITKKQDAGSKRHKSLNVYGEITKGSKQLLDDGVSSTIAISQPFHSDMVKPSIPDSPYNKKLAVMQKTDKTNKVTCHKYNKPQKVQGDAKHKITVYWDVLSEASAGVVKGAGEKVSVKYSQNAHLERPNIEIIERQQNFASTSRKRAADTPEIKHPEPNKLLKLNTTHQRLLSRKDSSIKFPKVLEPGVRGKKKYKDFHLTELSQTVAVKDEWSSLKNKTPLSLAAQYGHLECVQMILDTFILKSHPTMAIKEPLTLATKAKSPDAIMLLMGQKMSRTDFQSAILTAIREMYPDCLTALLAEKSKDRESLFDGVNLYHVLYTQSLMADYRYEMLPIMTNVLICSNEDVNAYNLFCTFPMYTLINCAFNITIGKKIFYYLQCLKILLENKANPHFDETEAPKLSGGGQLFSRSAYSSAINCIFENAANSINFFENAYWSKLFMKKTISTLTTSDRTPRQLLNDVLFNYMNTVCSLGLDRYIVRCLLRYGANADFRRDGKYVINVYFDKILPYLAKFEVNDSKSNWQQELDALMLMCHNISYKCLKEAELIFLNEHLLKCPIQALPLCRYFSYLINEMIMSPRSLTELVAQYIWIRLRRNEKRIKMLPLSADVISLILP